MKINELKQKVKRHASKIVSAFAGGAVMASGAITAFAEDTQAVAGAKELLSAATSELNLTNIVAILSAGIGVVIALYLGWWGARKLVRMLVNAFSKGKVSL